MTIKTQLQLPNPFIQVKLDELNPARLQAEQTRLYSMFYKTPEEELWAEEISGEIVYRLSLAHT